MPAIRIVKETAVAASPEACWTFWADPLNFEKTFDVVSKVVVQSDTRSLWTLNLPSGKTAEVLMERSGESPMLVAWRSLDNPITFNTEFAFQPAAHGANMRLEAEIALEGLQGMMLPAMKPVIEGRIDTVLVRFKSALESG